MRPIENPISADRKRNRSFNIPRVCSNNETLLHLRRTQKQRNEKKHVFFSNEPASEVQCESLFDEGMTEDEKRRRRNELWYSRSDFEEFLQERVASVRLLTSVGGDAVALKARYPGVCTRGLEAYQYTGLNNQIQFQRDLHQQVVFDEQLRQKKTAEEDVEKIRLLANMRSEWARKRAEQLALIDAIEARDMPLDLSNLGRGRGAPLVRTPPRPSSGSMSLSLLAAALPSRRRMPVNVAVLKQWNAQVLRQISSSDEALGVPIRRDSLVGHTIGALMQRGIPLPSDRPSSQERAELHECRQPQIPPKTT